MLNKLHKIASFSHDFSIDFDKIKFDLISEASTFF